MPPASIVRIRIFGFSRILSLSVSNRLLRTTSFEPRSTRPMLAEPGRATTAGIGFYKFRGPPLPQRRDEISLQHVILTIGSCPAAAVEPPPEISFPPLVTMSFSSNNLSLLKISDISHSYARDPSSLGEFMKFRFSVNPGDGKDRWEVEKTYFELQVLEKNKAHKLDVPLATAKLWKDCSPAELDAKQVCI